MTGIVTRVGRAGVRARAGLRRLGRWPLAGLLALLGALSALAQAPYHFVPLMVIGLSVLVLSLDDAARHGRRVRSGFVRAWAFGFGYFLAGTFWVANAFLVSSGDHAWLIWMPLTLLPAGLGLFYALGGALYAWLKPRGAGRIAVFAAIFTGVELLRSTLFSGFPWNLAGHVFAAGSPISQTASLVGAFGLTVIALFAFASPAVLVAHRVSARTAYPVAISVAVLAIAWGWGALRLQGAELQPTDIRLRLVQLDRPQTEMRPQFKREILNEYLELTTATPGLEEIDLVIWPEGAIPAYLLNEPRLLERMHEVLPTGTRLLLGAPHVTWTQADEPQFFYNSLHALRMQEDAVLVEGRYDKARLVPFGEANTLAAVTRPLGLETLSQYGIGYDPGAGPMEFALEGIPAFFPLICYEAIYSEYTPKGNNQSQWILNISNDSWFGHAVGPSQLVNQAAYRSIEQGLPLVRSSTAGMSMLIDPYGRKAHIPGVESAQVIDLVLLESVSEPFYGRYKPDSWLVVLMFFFGLVQVLPYRLSMLLAR